MTEMAPPQMFALIALVSGLLLGGGLGFLLRHLRAKSELLAMESALLQEAATMRADLKGRSVQLEALQLEKADLSRDLRQLGNQHSSAREELAGLRTRLEEERRVASEKLALLGAAERQLRESFEALAANALHQNSQQFFELAKTELSRIEKESKADSELRQKAVESLLAPVQESLAKVDLSIQGMEKERTSAWGELRKHLEVVTLGQEQLRGETGRLVTALRQPNVRGRWGEMQLRRVVEMAQMLPHCDFDEQVSVDTEGGKLRPDLRVRLPGGKSVIVDAKAPMAAYLEAIEAPDEAAREQKMKEHVAQIRQHITQLSAKAYWDQFHPSPEFVVMFLPSESFFTTALQHDPALMEAGVDNKVLPASPLTLIALLRAVAYAWRQEQIAENAEEIRELGAQLHERVKKLAEHMTRLGKNLSTAVDAYNGAVGTLESRVLVGTRRFSELGAASKDEEIPEVPPVEKFVREFQVEGLKPLPPGEDAA